MKLDQLSNPRIGPAAKQSQPTRAGDGAAHFWVLILLVSLLAGATMAVQAGTLRTQQIQLHQGWNSIFLEVFPTNGAPEAVFLNSPVSIVATYFPLANSVEFVRDPVRIDFKKEGWGVWYAPRRTDAFLSSLHAIDGNRAYLVYCDSEFTWSIDGDVSFESIRWKSDSFNHVGFCVDPQSPPTFGKFFAGSQAHRERKVYRLVNERWSRVADPDATPMRSGEGLWVYCQGASDYQGPLFASIPMGRAIVFGNPAQSRITLGNNSVDPLGVRVELQGGTIPLAYVLTALGNSQIQGLFVDLPQNYSLPALEPGAQRYFTLHVRTERMTQGTQSDLLKLSSDMGTVVWLPLAAQREDLGGTP